MKATSHTGRSLTRWLVLALATAAIAVPAVQAANRQAGDGLDRYLANNAPASPIYDSHDFVSSQVDASPIYDSHDFVSSQPLGTPTPVDVATEPGFDWADAGIGAGVAFGAMLLAAAALGVRSRGRVAHS